MNMATCSTNNDDDQIISELLYVIQRFLSTGPCSQSAEVLKSELERYKLLPYRIDYTGKSHPRTFEEYDSFLKDIVPVDYLKRLSKFIPHLLHLNNHNNNSSTNRQKLSLLSGSKNALLSLTAGDLDNNPKKHKTLQKLKDLTHCPAINISNTFNIANIVSNRQILGNKIRTLCSSDFLISKTQMHARIFGHLSSIFCVAFDRSGQYVFTGADDNLIKLWLISDARLLFTFRGFSGEITDLAISPENTLLAAGSCDKTIRIWCLRTGAPIAVLQGHSAMVTSLQFLPYVNENNRWLVSTGNDCCVCFWKWDFLTNEFNTKPIKYPERLRVGGQMICSSHSAGGTFVVTGGTDYYVRVYVVRDFGPRRIIETEGHTDRVSSVQWAHNSLRFLTGSRDGLTKIWTCCGPEWKTVSLSMDSRYENGKGMVPVSSIDVKNLRLKVTMAIWSRDDAFVVTAVSDLTLRVWNPTDGTMLRFLLGHTDEVYVLEPHPINKNVIMSAGHDGSLILWDISTGQQKKKLTNEIENCGHGAFFDARFASQGDKIAAVDSHGHLVLFGSYAQQLHNIIGEQFFHTDYRPLLRDQNQYVVDEQTQLAPHLMPPPFLVNSDGDPYPPDLQRRVPGKEKCSDAFLVPAIRPNVQNTGAEIVDIDNPEGQANRLGSSTQLYSAWATRYLIRPLDSPVLQQLIKTNEALGLEELQLYNQEMSRPVAPILIEVPVGPRNRTRPKRRHRREDAADPSRVTVADNRTVAVQNQYNDYDDSAEDEDYTENLNVNSGRRSTSSGSDEDTSDSNNSTRSAYSTTNSKMSHQESSSRRITLRSGAKLDSPSSENDSSSSSQDENEPSTSQVVNRKPKRQKSKTLQQHKKVSTNKDYDNNNSGRKKESNKTNRRPKRYKALRRYTPESDNERAGTGLMQKPINLANPPTSLKDVPDKFFFPDWMTSLMPRKSPYFPQVLDEVVYFPLGHRLYIEAVEKLKLCQFPAHNLPWYRSDMGDHEFAIVQNVKYEILPIRLCCVRLAQINPKNGRQTGFVYTVKYHDVNHVVDFLVQRHYFDESMRRKWKQGDKFQTVIDDSWWFGTVLKKQPYDLEHCPNSQFLSLQVFWDNGDEEKLSPWDLEPFDAKSFATKKGVCAPINDDELKRLMMQRREPQPVDWNGVADSCAEVRRLQRGLDALVILPCATAFAAPVDLNTYPMYCICVEYPCDLGTIRERLANKYYRRIQSVEYDIRQIMKNAVTFNEPRSQIVQQAKLVCNVLLQYARDTTCEDISVIYNDALENGLPKKEKTATKANSGKVYNKRERRHKKQEYSIDGKSLRSQKDWLEDCSKVIELVKHADSLYKNLLTNAGNDSEHSFNADDVTSTISLKMMDEQLINEQYDSPQQFADDVISWFNNRKADRANKRSKLYLGMLRLRGRANQLLQPILDAWRSKSSVQVYNTRKTSSRKSSPNPKANHHHSEPTNFTNIKPHQPKRVIIDRSEESTNDSDLPGTSSMSLANLHNRQKINRNHKQEKIEKIETIGNQHKSFRREKETEPPSESPSKRLAASKKINYNESSESSDANDRLPKRQKLQKRSESAARRNFTAAASPSMLGSESEELGAVPKNLKRHNVRKLNVKKNNSGQESTNEDEDEMMTSSSDGEKNPVVVETHTSSRGRICKLRRFRD